MANGTTNDVVEIKFGVAGGTDLSGESAKLIQTQLTKIAEQINLKVNIDKEHFTKQLAELQAQLEKALGNLNININTKTATKGGSGAVSEEEAAKKLATAYNSAQKALEKYYQSEIKYSKLQAAGKEDTVAGVTAKNQISKNLENYKAQEAALESLAGKDNERVKAIEAEAQELKDVLTTEQKIVEANSASPTAVAKLESKAASLYTDNGFDKVIARSKEAKQAVDDFNEHVHAALYDDKDNAYSSVPKQTVEQLNTEFVKTTAKLKEIQRETDTAGNKIKEAFNNKVVQRIAQMLVLLVMRALRQVYTNVKKIDAAMTQLKIVTEASSKAYEKYADTVAESAKKIGSSISDLIDSTTTYARLGYSLSDAETLAELTTVYSNIGDINVDDATTNITGIIKAFGLGAEQLEDVLDLLVYVGNHYAITSAEIGSGMNNAAASLAALGNTLEQATGILTAANTTVQDIDKASTAVRTIAARLSNSTTELQELGESTDDVLATANLTAEMNAYGIAVTDANGELLSTYEILGNIANAWDELDKTQQAAIASTVAGTRQQSIFYSIMANWEEAEEIASSAEAATNSLQDAQEEYLNSIEGQMAQLSASWEDFSTNLLDSDLVKALVNILELITNILNNVVSAGDGTIVKIALVTAAVGLLWAVLSKLKKVFSGLYKSVNDAIDKDIEMTFSLDGVSTAAETASMKLKKMASSALALVAAFAIFTTVSMILENFGGTASSVTKIVIGCITAITAAIMAFNTSNPFGWIVLAVSAVAMAVEGINDLIQAHSLDGLIDKANEAKEAWQEAADALEETTEKLQDINDQIDELNGKDSLTLVDEQQLAYLKQEAAILEQLQSQQEAAAEQAEKESVDATKTAIDRLESQEEIIDDILRNWDDATDEEKTRVLDYLNQMQELLGDYEYQLPEYDEEGNLVKGLEDWQEEINAMLDEEYEVFDKYSIATGAADEAWASILNRVKYSDAVNTLTKYVNDLKNTSEITQESLEGLGDEVNELFAYLNEVGLWDGKNWDELIASIVELRDGMASLVALSVTDNIDAITDKYEALSDALKDVADNGVVSLDSLEKLAESYPSLLEKYFTKTLGGYTLNSNYSDKSNFEILQDMALTDLQTYQAALEEAQGTLSGLTYGDFDYETALKNVAIAQDNLNLQTTEWATILREAYIDEQTESLEGMQDALEDQLDIYKELIDIRKDLLETYQEEINYQKELAKKQKTVADLQTELTLARLDTSAAGQARVRELQSELEEAQDELDEYTLEHAVEDITKKLDDSYNEYEAFIQAQVDKLADKLDNIAIDLVNALGEVKGAIETTNSTSDMADLYLKIMTQLESGMSSSGVSDYVEAVKNGDYETADTLYSAAQEVSNNYAEPEQEPVVETKNANDITDEIYVMPGAVASGFTKKEGNDGDVKFNGGTYRCETAMDCSSNSKLQYSTGSNGLNLADGNCFYYNGDIYALQDGAIIRLQSTKGAYWNPAAWGKGLYSDLLGDTKAYFGIYHTGGFVGDFSSMASNEEFAKLLKGEFVSTPQQMDNFMRYTLPALRTSGDSQNIFNSPLVSIQTGEITKDSLPEFKKIVNETVKRVKTEMESALSRAGRTV